MKSFATISDYISGQHSSVQPLLSQIRAAITRAVPAATESIGYGMPAYKLNGKPLIYFAVFARHIGIYPTPSGVEAFKQAFKPYKTGKGSVQFPLDQPFPYDLLAKLISYRVQEILSKAS